MKAVVLLLFLSPLLTRCGAEFKPFDCHDAQGYSYEKSGVKTIYPFSERFPIQAYCDTDTDQGRWTVFQRRMNGNVNFYRGWDQYVSGFGDVAEEHWLGKRIAVTSCAPLWAPSCFPAQHFTVALPYWLEFLHRITARRPQELLVEMEDFEGNRTSARYSSFSVGSECDGYRLTVSGFNGGVAGDSLKVHNNMRFSTFDKDQDESSGNCAKRFLGAFWYEHCHDTNPNGVYRWGADDTLHAVGVEWNTWKGQDYSLKSISFKTRPSSWPL